MTLLVSGVLLWSILHFLPALNPGFRKSLLGRIGEGPYKAVFGVVMLAAVGLMIAGWRSAPYVYVYTAPEWGDLVHLVLMLAAFILFFAPYIRNSISRAIRHPQLTGVAVACAGHLLASGSNRAVVLFGGLALWSIIEILLLNRRDGPWEKPEPASAGSNTRLILTGLGFYLAFLFTHLWLFGVSPIPL